MRRLCLKYITSRKNPHPLRRLCPPPPPMTSASPAAPGEGEGTAAGRCCSSNSEMNSCWRNSSLILLGVLSLIFLLRSVATRGMTVDEEQQQHLTGHYDDKTQTSGGMLSLVTSNPDTKKNHFRRKHRFLRTDHFLQLVPFLLTVSTCTVPRISSLYSSSSATFFFLRRDQRLAHEGGRRGLPLRKTQTPPFSSSAFAHLCPWSVRTPGVRTPLHQHRV